jgi:hypothetical protein
MDKLKTPPLKPDVVEAQAILSNFTTVPSALVGRTVKSLDELRGLFPEDKHSGPVILLARGIETVGASGSFDIYAQPDRISPDREAIRSLLEGESEYVAYGCGRCKKITIGKPRLEPGSDNHLNAYCANCNALLVNTRMGFS